MIAQNHSYVQAGTYVAQVYFMSNQNVLDCSSTLVNTGCAYYSGKLFIRGDNNCYYDYGVDFPIIFPYSIDVSKDNFVLDTAQSLDRWL